MSPPLPDAPAPDAPAPDGPAPDGPAPDAPAPGRRTRVLGTLGARLVAGAVLLVVLVVSATGVATYLSLRSYLSGRLDSQLTSSADPGLVRQVVSFTAASNGMHGPRVPQRLWLLILRPDGTQTSVQPPVTESTEQMKLTAAQRAVGHGLGARRATLTTTDGHTLRVAAVQFDDAVVLVGLDTNEISKTLHRLVVLELLIGLGAVLLAFGATTWGVGAGLRPLKRVTSTAQEVTAELSPDGAGLDRRVPFSSSTTEVGQLASSFNTMLDTVEAEFSARRQSEERMRQFLADASHELRTPLTSIRGYAELGRLQATRRSFERPANGSAPPHPGPADPDDTLARIEAEGTRMSRLVEDLLILARGDESTPLAHASVDVPALVVDAVADVRLSQPDRPITVSVDPGLTVDGDRDQILRVIRNLVTNAAVHTDPGGPIRVSGHREADQVVLQVADSGPGLPAEEAAHVFERFWRADAARTRARGGSGLGMSIVAQIVEAHDGQVYFDSTVERGSTVTVILPDLEDEVVTE